MVQVAPPFQLDGRWVTLIDTPGFDDTTRSDTEILTQIAAFLANTYASGKKLAGVIYMHRISDVRMGGISTRNFKIFRQLCGEGTLRNVVIVTNMWSQVAPDVGEAREAELASDERFFRPALEKGAQMLRNDNAKGVVDPARAGGPGEGYSADCGGGEELNRELNAQIQRHQEEMAKLQQDLQEAIRVRDEELKKELEIETRKLQAAMTRKQNDAEKLASEYRLELERLKKQNAEAEKRGTERAERNFFVAVVRIAITTAAVVLACVAASN
ncbi:p-loop containing nucleoside triphosphate hydrolase protein [Mycena sanguinolenta]|uniref:p-loop containing nucleoside triphosphate hydrolase protein n=1 Tax=Mycena sanguinolenta TaxID=230812 RepID=A0A8H6Z8Y4_9AGAR|nr:p-loop containing nucleoside triphosphate hydrolase protein [Mycena sanguinolenta]